MLGGFLIPEVLSPFIYKMVELHTVLSTWHKASKQEMTACLSQEEASPCLPGTHGAWQAVGVHSGLLMVELRSVRPLLPRRRKWQPTPVFLPGESQGWGSLVGCRLWGRTESDTTEAT